MNQECVQPSSEFDYVVIGAGSAGCVVAGRLSEDPQKTVCIIEAGPSDRSPRISIPAGIIALINSNKFNWQFRSTPQPQSAGRSLSVRRGKALGGSSAVNGMLYIRGRASDYDGWASQGCTGWKWEDVLPYFLKAENNADIHDELHGSEGPLKVENLRSINRLSREFIEGATLLQFPRNADFNGTSQEGFGYYQVTQHNGRRWSTSDAYLRPAMRRPNLVVETGWEAEEILFDGDRATGVRLARGAQQKVIGIRCEAIVAAGSIGSPTILLKSGIGPAAQLGALGIAPRQNAPVGEHLQDHPYAAIICNGGAPSYSLSLRGLPAMFMAPLQYFLRRRGMLVSNMFESGGFFRSSPDAAEPDIQVDFIPGRALNERNRIEWGEGYYADACLLNPRSRGRLWLERENGKLFARINLGLLTDDDDAVRLAMGIQTVRRIIVSGPLKEHAAREMFPGAQVSSLDDMVQFVSENVEPGYHPTGTCRMGASNDPRSVVAPDLKVIGFRNLRVVDASVMPAVTSGNTNAPTIMIGEKGADLIKSAK